MIKAASILALLFFTGMAHAGDDFNVRVARATKIERSSPVGREYLMRFMQTVVGNQKHYRANPDAPIYDALVDIVQKTMGVAGAVRAALTPLSGEILFAILYGSVAKGADRAQSDIDVLIVSDTLPLDRIFATLEPVEKAMGRTVSPTVYTSGEFLRRRSQSNAFLTRVLDGAHVVLLGAEDDVGAS